MLKFTEKPPSANRIHFLHSEDILVLLGRLPEEIWTRLREVHFSDKAWGNRILGYVTNRGRRDITLCALPSQISLGRHCKIHDLSARRFGASPRGQWPRYAVRRFLLYNVVLHELGHMQIVNRKAKLPRRKFAGERKAQEFANAWRHRLWSNWFEHPDPIHNPPTEDELALVNSELRNAQTPVHLVLA